MFRKCVSSVPDEDLAELVAMPVVVLQQPEQREWLAPSILSHEPTCPSECWRLLAVELVVEPVATHEVRAAARKTNLKPNSANAVTQCVESVVMHCHQNEIPVWAQQTRSCVAHPVMTKPELIDLVATDLHEVQVVGVHQPWWRLYFLRFVEVQRDKQPCHNCSD